MTIAAAGWATTTITPPLGLPMGGRGARFSPGEQVLDDLLAQAIVLRDDAGNRLVLISVDLIELSSPHSDQIACDVAAALDLPPAHVLINASHTHSGPMMGIHRYATRKATPANLTAYFESLVPTITKLVLHAAADLTPATFTWHMGRSQIGINRRRLIDGEIVLGPNPQGVYDDSLWVLDVQATDQPARRAVLFSHACHPVMVYGFNWTALSAEWPGQARQALRQTLGNAVHAQFFQGLAGNIRPRILGDLTTGRFRVAKPEEVALVGRQIAQDVTTTLAQPGDALRLKLASERSWFNASRQDDIPPRSHWEEKLTSEQEHEREAADYWLSRYDSDGIPPFHATPWPVGLVRLTDDHLIAWFGGEPVSEWRAILEKALPGKKLTTWGYTHDCVGYLATDELLPQGGYEVTYSWLGNQSPSIFKTGLDDKAARAFGKLHALLSL